MISITDKIPVRGKYLIKYFIYKVTSESNLFLEWTEIFKINFDRLKFYEQYMQIQLAVCINVWLVDAVHGSTEVTFGDV